jgi:hypothetical protein
MPMHTHAHTLCSCVGPLGSHPHPHTHIYIYTHTHTHTHTYTLHLCWSPWLTSAPTLRPAAFTSNISVPQPSRTRFRPTASCVWLPLFERMSICERERVSVCERVSVHVDRYKRVVTARTHMLTWIPRDCVARACGARHERADRRLFFSLPSSHAHTHF